MVRLRLFICCLNNVLIGTNMVSNFLGGYLACVLHVRNNYFFILLLRRLTALGKGLLYYKQLNIGFYSLFNF